MTIDPEALIAEARRWATKADEYIEDDLIVRLSDALESTLAELRQERERAGFYQLELHTSDDIARLRLQRAHKAEAALSRAEETIEKIDGEVKNFEQSDNDAMCEIERLLTEYDKQKGADDDE